MKIGFIGAGNMASALLRGLQRSETLDLTEIRISSSDGASAARLAEATGGQAVSNREAARDSEVVILCVKPAQAHEVLEQIYRDLSSQTFVSIVAGLSIAQIQKVLGSKLTIARAMPNTPLLVGQGCTSLAFGSETPEETKDLVESLFRAAGKTFRLPETQFDTITALSGSGPAYFFLVVEALVDAAVAQGLPRPMAHAVAVQTALGAASLLDQSDDPPAELRARVTSPKGTTAAGLLALEEGRIRFTLARALQTSAERSRQLNQASS